jgi:hypothetical protein
MQNRSSLPSSFATLSLAVALWLVPSGCFISRSRSNPALSPDAVSRIVPGASTAEDVTRLLGAPNDVVQLGRKSAWLYEHTVEKQTAAFLVLLGLRGVDTQADRVWVFLDETGNVTNVGTLFQAAEAEYDLPVF